jgi:hypothetical protein
MWRASLLIFTFALFAVVTTVAQAAPSGAIP